MAIKSLFELAVKPAKPARPAQPARPAKEARPAKPAKPAVPPKPEKKPNLVKLRSFRVDYTYVDKNGTKKVGSVKKQAKDGNAAKHSLQLDLDRQKVKNAKVGKVTPESD